ncbi:FAD-binding oxidoreductase [Aspergillus homomorphus CBS 101889]|uniref:6-hydroxy-D-nicotine oxidase n=1 Tax=Aspergillus homomorphus (strain CBS 101889) TaxID=1450537 RepID=A0A395HV78_ASPHC|nr:6-hydroxy-D-nicotine oxidase [Aspergillus homomorphus CBS 101889]RAL10134.1 6-hydroxy-D-nicotine oxidase [Aspergillus homomorphus CBS 101889]
MAATAFDQLRSLFPENTNDKVVTPIDNDSDKYQAAVSSPWSQTCWIPAAGYIYLSSVQELIEALAIVRKTGTKFAIRTTGHNPNAGFSSADETAVLVTTNEGEVYAWLEERGLSAIGGRDPQVGLGGFLLGGGMGALPNLYGLGADGVRNFEVLLADGRLVNANANENSDLYRALKGGGSNFGIVTRFDLATHPLINVQYTINLYSPEDHVAINRATVAVQQAMEEDPKIGLFTTFNNGFVAVGLLYGDHPAEAPKAFEPFQTLKSLVATALPFTNGTLLSLAQAMGHPQIAQKRRICKISTQVSHDLYEEVFKAWGEVSKTLPTGAVLHYTIQPFGKAGVRVGKDRGENIMGHEDVPQCWWVFTCEWPKDGSDDAAAQNAIETMSETVQSLAKARGILLDFKCMSFATATQEVLGSYGAENVRRIQEVAAKYDPEGVFQKLQNGGFLLRDNI